MSPSVRNVSSSNPRHSARSVKKEESLDHDLQSLPVSDHASELSSSALLEALSLWDIDVPLGTEEESRLKANGDIKRPRNAFMWFRSIFERERKRRNPNVRHTNQCDVSSEAANRWRAMTAEDQRPFYDKASVEKQRYLELYPMYKYAPVGSKPKASARRSRPTPASDAARSSVESEDEYRPTRVPKRQRSPTIPRRQSIATKRPTKTSVKRESPSSPILRHSLTSSPSLPKRETLSPPPAPQPEPSKRADMMNPPSTNEFFFDIDSSADMVLEDIIDSQFIGPQSPGMVQDSWEAGEFMGLDLDYSMILESQPIIADEPLRFSCPMWGSDSGSSGFPEAGVSNVNVGLFALSEIERPFCPHEFMNEL